ncbi:MAG: hypothetical protein ACRBEQ_00305, partial [Hyphomonas sp.]
MALPSRMTRGASWESKLPHFHKRGFTPKATGMDDIVFQTLNLALEDGAVSLPADGPVLFLRAALSPFLTQLPRDRVVCHQSFKPDHDALKAAGYNVLAPDETDLPA